MPAIGQTETTWLHDYARSHHERKSIKIES